MAKFSEKLRETEKTLGVRGGEPLKSTNAVVWTSLYGVDLFEPIYHYKPRLSPWNDTSHAIHELRNRSMGLGLWNR